MKKIIYSSANKTLNSNIYTLNPDSNTTLYGEQIPSQFQWLTSDIQRSTAEKLEQPIV